MSNIASRGANLLSMKLQCPDCQKPVPAQDVNIKLGVGKCLACDAVFSLVDQIGTPMFAKRKDLPLAPPKNYRIDDFGPEITVQWSWYSHAVWFMLLFALFWDGFLLVWYGAAVGSLTSGKNLGNLWFMLLFPILHVAVGVGFTYAVLSMFVNRTVIKIASGELSVWHGPLPTWGKCRVSTADITQLFSTEHCHRRKRGHSYSYSVTALLTNGERMGLITNLQDSFEALFLERFLEEKLKIANQRVPGEFRD
jgi:hypothetical protein